MTALRRAQYSVAIAWFPSCCWLQLQPWITHGGCDIATTSNAQCLGAPCPSPEAFTLTSTLDGTPPGTILRCHRMVSFMLLASIAALDLKRRLRHCHHCCCAVPGCTLPSTWSFHLAFIPQRHSIGHRSTEYSFAMAWSPSCCWFQLLPLIAHGGYDIATTAVQCKVRIGWR